MLLYINKILEFSKVNKQINISFSHLAVIKICLTLLCYHISCYVKSYVNYSLFEDNDVNDFLVDRRVLIKAE